MKKVLCVRRGLSILRSVPVPLSLENSMKKSALLRSVFIPALVVTLASTAPSSRAVVLYDGISDVTAVGVGNNAGNTFMGEGLALDVGSFSAALNQISSFEVAIANVSGAAISAPVRLNMWLYQTFDPSSIAPAQVFSNQLGTPGSPTFTFDFANISLANNTYGTTTLTLGAPVTITPTSGTAMGIALNWQMDQGAGFVNVPGVTTLVRGGAGQPPPTVGTNLTGTAPIFGYFRNASGEVNGNFLSTSVRQIGDNSGLFMRINGPDPIPEPAPAVLSIFFGLTLLRRRRS